MGYSSYGKTKGIQEARDGKENQVGIGTCERKGEERKSDATKFMVVTSLRSHFFWPILIPGQGKAGHRAKGKRQKGKRVQPIVDKCWTGSSL